jgi:hypothetical protein
MAEGVAGEPRTAQAVRGPPPGPPYNFFRAGGDVRVYPQGVKAVGAGALGVPRLSAG